MTGKHWAALIVAGAVAVGAGCVSVRNRGYAESLRPACPLPFPPPVRQQVYLFMMNGYDVLELSGMLGLRTKMCQAGYSKVYYAQRPDRAWYYRELRRINRDEPGARFVLLGYGAGAENTRLLAWEAARDRLPVDAVVFLDPVGASGELDMTLPFHTAVIRSRHWTGAPDLTGRENVTLPSLGHWTLPGDEATVHYLTQLMTASAANIRLDPPDALPHLALTDRPDPTPRPVDPATLAQPLDEWDFLKPISPFPSLPPICIPKVVLPPGHREIFGEFSAGS